MTELSFVDVKTTSVKDLHDWKKSYRAPDSVGGNDERFVAGVAAYELKEDLDRIYQALKDEYEFLRRDLTASDPEEGSGSILTPYFDYSIGVALDPEDPTKLRWTRTVHHVKAPERLAGKEFAAVFDESFRAVEFAFATPISVADFIDVLETTKQPNVKITYDREATYCDLTLKGITGNVHITSVGLTLTHPKPQPVKTLVRSFDAVSKAIGRADVPLLGAVRKKSS